MTGELVYSICSLGTCIRIISTISRTNPVESPFSALRLRTDAARRFKKVANARAVIWKMLIVAEKRFRRLKAPHLMKEVYQGIQYVNGVPVNQVTEEKAA